MSDSRIAWHPAFVEVIQLELAAYLNFLEFRPEEQVSEEPLRADVFIIKKKPELEISKGLGHCSGSGMSWSIKVHKIILR